MKLLSATPSPYARKVRIALAEKGLPFELLTEVPWASRKPLPNSLPTTNVTIWPRVSSKRSRLCEQFLLPS